MLRHDWDEVCTGNPVIGGLCWDRVGGKGDVPIAARVVVASGSGAKEDEKFEGRIAVANLDRYRDSFSAVSHV